MATGGKVLIKNMREEELVSFLSQRMGEDTTRPERRARQLTTWIYRRKIRSLDEADNHDMSFSAPFKAWFNKNVEISGQLSLQAVHDAADGTMKMVFSLDSDPSKEIESVLIPMAGMKGEGISRYTLCVSSQAGCAMNCQFCATGKLGLLGNLSTAQIVEQVVEARRLLDERGIKKQIQNITFMGMGEPLHNFEAVIAAVDIIAVGLEISRTKILVSTVGLLPQMRQFVAVNKLNKLALSLHATTDNVRDRIVPVNNRYPIADLVSFLEEYFPLSDVDGKRLKGDRFIVIEYLLLRGVNDTAEDAHRLVSLLKNVYCMVNLIVFNPHDGATQFEKSREEDVRAFKSILSKGGKVCTIRFSKGDDAMAACGQLQGRGGLRV